MRGRNHKGLVTYDRKTKKDAFYWYKANWSEEPVLWLAGKRNERSESDSVKVIVYCNAGLPKLVLNNEELGDMEKGINEVHFIKYILLNKGENSVVVRAVKKDGELIDKILLIR